MLTSVSHDATAESFSARTKVAVVITGLQVGGAETFLGELLKHTPGDLEIRVFSLIDGGPIAERIEAMGIPVTGLGMEAGRPSVRALFELRGHLARFRPTIVHTWMYHADLLGGVAAKLAGVPHVIWHLHNSDLSPARVRLMTRLVVRVNGLFSRFLPSVVLSCSRAAVKTHVAYGYAAHKIVVVPNGVDTQRFAPQPEAAASVRAEFDIPESLPVIGLVARVDPQKNHEGFFEAVRLFFEMGGDAHFLLVGRGVTPDHWQLPRWRDATGRPERITLAGQRSDAPRLMAGFDVATSASLGEAFPMVLIEAMACETPCVATAVGDSELIVGDAGVVVMAGDPAALAQAWIEFLRRPADERSALGVRARERVLDSYAIQSVAGRIWRSYRCVGRGASAVRQAARGPHPHVAYLSLQAVTQGQDSWAAVNEIVSEWQESGWNVDRWFPDYPETGAPGAVGRALEMWRLQRELKRDIYLYDALYVRGHTMAYPGSRWARAAGVPVFQECNGTYEDLFIAWPAARLGRPLFEHMQRAQYRDARFVFCGTEPQHRWLNAETGHDRVIVSPNGANIELFTPAAPRREGLPERYALFFGQFAPWQGIEVLVAAKRSSEWPSGVDLVFVGAGEREPVVRGAVNHDQGTHYLGRLPYEELAGVIAHSVASTSPQFTQERGSQGFSALKLYESMACGVPVIGSDYPGVADVIERYDAGIVVTPGKADELARAVATLAANESEARRMGANGRAAVEREATWAARAQQRRIVIEAVMGDHRQRAECGA
ncbi:MAG: glycosyltransferase [Coriobacteriia bacterium]|nr:glycosyltransferase [Coriobacteriia bacterium]